MTPTECPLLAERITKSLLGYGVIAGPFYVIVAAAQAMFRDGYDPTRHSVSQLANGDFGWIQVANFVVTGAMTIAAAIGIGRALPAGRAARWATALLCGYGAGLLAAGALRADPSDGFPPGTPRGVGPMSWHGTGHLIVAGIGFACLIAAGFVVAACLAALNAVGWAWFSRVTATVFAAALLSLASGLGGRVAVIAFTVAVVWVWAWLAAVSVMLYRRVGSS